MPVMPITAPALIAFTSSLSSSRQPIPNQITAADVSTTATVASTREGIFSKARLHMRQTRADRIRNQTSRPSSRVAGLASEPLQNGQRMLNARVFLSSRSSLGHASPQIIAPSAASSPPHDSLISFSMLLASSSGSFSPISNTRMDASMTSTYLT